MTEEQITYVVNQLEAGFDESAVRGALISAGYSEVQVDELFRVAHDRMAGPIEPPEPPEPPAQPPGYERENALAETVSSGFGTRKKLFVGIILTLCILLIFGATVFAFVTGKIAIPFFGGAPYDEDKIIEDLASAFGRLESASYAASLSATVGERDTDVYPFPQRHQSVYDYGSDPYSDFESEFSFLPTDLSVFLELSGDFDRSSPDASDGRSQLIAELESDDFSFNADLEFVYSKQQGFYVRVNRFPSLFIDVSQVKGEWIHLDTGIAESFIGTTRMAEEEEEVQEVMREQMRIILSEAARHDFLALKEEPVQEDLGGVKAYRYTFMINAASARAFYENVTEELERKYGNDHLLAEFGIMDDIELYSSEKYIDYINTHFPLTVWARSDGLPVRIGTDARIAFNEDSLFYVKDKQVNLGIFVDFTNINEPVVVEMPSESITIEEAAERAPILGIMLDSFTYAEIKGEDALKKSTINSLRIEAELYYDDNGLSYQGFCNSIYSDPYLTEDIYIWNFTCNDEPSAYAVEVEVSDGFYCVDSTGYSSFSSSRVSEISGTSCGAWMEEYETEGTGIF